MRDTSEHDFAYLYSIFICPDGTEDTKLYVRDLPDITVGPW